MAADNSGPQGQPGAPPRARLAPRGRRHPGLRPRPGRARARAGEGRGARRGRVTAASPEALWHPSAELVERSRLTEYMRWLQSERGLGFDCLRGALALVGRRPRWILGIDLGLLRGARRRRARAGPRRARDARRRVVPGHQPQLRRARLRRQGGRRGGDPPRLRAARARRAELGRAARPGRRRRRRAARDRRRSGRPRRRLHAEHPRGDRRLPGQRLDRRDLVELLARLRAGQRHRPLRPDRAQGPVRRRRLRLRRQALRPPRRARRAAGGDAEPRAHRRPPLPRPRSGSRAAARRDALAGAARRRRGQRARASSASPSTTRSGSSTPRGRPGCRKRSSRARAGSCSST